VRHLICVDSKGQTGCFERCSRDFQIALSKTRLETAPTSPFSGILVFKICAIQMTHARARKSFMGLKLIAHPERRQSRAIYRPLLRSPATSSPGGQSIRHTFHTF